MEHQLQSSMEPTKITCPHCGNDNCFVETQTIEDNQEVSSYMCIDCGYTTTTLNVEGTDFVKGYEEVTAELIRNLRWVDPNTNLVWYPLVLNFPSFGIIFPDGTSVFDWSWRAAPAIGVAFEEREKYPIPGQEGEYYTKRVDIANNSRLFNSDDFYSACKYLGFIQ